MKTINLVNAYVLPNLFYELIFLEEHGIDARKQDWTDRKYIDQTIQNFVIPQFNKFTNETQAVVRNTLRYLLATQDVGSEIWDTIWEVSSAPIPTPDGVRSFVQRCAELLFKDDAPPLSLELAQYNVNHEMQIANRLN